MTTYNDVLNFWFNELSFKDWFSKNDEIDKKIKEKFLKTHEMATKGELYTWRKTPEGRLAEIIVLDQFSRNLFRESAKAFSFDTHALILAQEMIGLGLDQKLDIKMRAFVYLPYMHSESLMIHEIAEKLFSQEGLEENYKFELSHKEVIEKFGRYPHRNEVLNRESTKEELEYLKENKGW